MSFRASKVDDNQSEIVKAFRWLGCDVKCMHAVGEGFPDLIVEISGSNILVEVKDGSKPPSARKLTPQQVLFHKEWRGHKAVVKDTEEVAALVSKYRSYAYKILEAGISLEGCQ